MYKEMSGSVSQLVQAQQEGRSHGETNNFLPLLLMTKPDTEQVETTGWNAASNHAGSTPQAWKRHICSKFQFSDLVMVNLIIFYWKEF